MQISSKAALHHLHVRAIAKWIMWCFYCRESPTTGEKEMEIYTNGCCSRFILAIWPLQHRHLWFKVWEKQNVGHCCRHGICFYQRTQKEGGRNISDWEQQIKKDDIFGSFNCDQHFSSSHKGKHISDCYHYCWIQRSKTRFLQNTSINETVLCYSV